MPSTNPCPPLPDPQPEPTPNCAASLCFPHCSGPAPAPTPASATQGPGPKPQTLGSTTVSSVPGPRLAGGDPGLRQPQSPEAPRPPLASCRPPSSPYCPGDWHPPPTSLPISSATTSLPPPSPSSAQHPAVELRPATQAPSINNRSGPTDHSSTMGSALSPPGHAPRKPMAPLLGLRPGAPGRKHQLPTDSGRAAGGLAGKLAGVRGPQVGLVEESQYSQGGRGETLPFCTPVTSSRAPSRSGPLPWWGPVQSPWGWGAPSGAGRTQGGYRAQACPLSYRSPG